jgi:hypothetical protein
VVGLATAATEIVNRSPGIGPVPEVDVG